MLTHVLFFVLGLAALIAGAESLVRGASRIALSLGKENAPSILISGLVAGPAVSLYGSPTLPRRSQGSSAGAPATSP
jgi:hypothetical protein